MIKLTRIATTVAVLFLLALLLPGAGSSHEEEFPAKQLISS